MASLRQMAPRASLSLHSKQLQQLRLLPHFRYATTAATRPPPKPRVLEKPERFNPPSHPSRRARPRQYPGPPLSEHQRQAQKLRKYPHMMPAEGSFLHWFLTSRAVHASITLTVLVSLVLTIWFTDFYYNTPYRDILPPNDMVLSHPFAFIARYWDVYRMHVDYVSAETAERRRQKVEDVAKRAEYRRAHGLEKEGIFAPSPQKPDPREARQAAIREGGTDVNVTAPTAENIADKERDEVYVDFDGQSRPVRKKWLGIF